MGSSHSKLLCFRRRHRRLSAVPTTLIIDPGPVPASEAHGLRQVNDQKLSAVPTGTETLLHVIDAEPMPAAPLAPPLTIDNKNSNVNNVSGSATVVNDNPNIHVLLSPGSTVNYNPVNHFGTTLPDESVSDLLSLL